MTKNRSTKNALLSSVLALVLCCSMLLGTTFAWFTDSVTSANNVIISGNLDIELEYWNADSKKWVDVNGEDEILTNKLWEPGVTEVAYLRVANAGSLALKYQLGVNIVSETKGVNQKGEEFKLSDYIQFGVIEGVNGATGAYASREAAVAAVTDAKIISAGYTKAATMASNGELYLALVVYMPTTVGNVANHDGENVPKIELGINVFATQTVAEKDSFETPDYDADAWHPEMKVTTAGELITAINAIEDGATIVLANDITFDESSRMSSGGSWYEGIYYVGDKSFTLDLNGKKVTNDSSVNDYLMLFKNDGSKESVVTIKNGTLEASSSAYCAICTSTTSTQKITINLENVNVIGGNSNGAVIKVRGGAELNVKAGTVITGKDSYVGIECAAATVNVYDGAEIYQNGTSSYVGSLIGVSGNGTANVYGGYGKSAQGAFIAMTSGGAINVYGGKWIANTDGTYANGNKSALIAQSEKGASSVINVYGGEFFGGYNCYGAAVGDAQINISGGKFNADPATYVADTFKALLGADGFYHIVSEDVDYIISTPEEFAEFAAEVNKGEEYCGNTYAGKTVALVNDIDFGGAEWTPIGNFGSTSKQFQGVFDGQNHTVSNFVITKKSPDRAGKNRSPEGFFGNVNGTIKNLTIANAMVKVTDDGRFVGAMIGRLNGGLVENCKLVDSYVEGSAWQIGGIVGQVNAGTIQGCVVENTTVVGKAGVAAIAGFQMDAKETIINECTVKNCTIAQKGSYGEDYDDMFAAVLGCINNSSATVKINNCAVENTTVKGATSFALFGYVEAGAQLTVDGAKCVSSAEELMEALNSGVSSVIVLNTIEDTTVKLPATLKNVTIKGVDGVVTFKNTTVSAADGNSYCYENLTFDGITFDNSRIVLTGWRNGEETIKNLTVTNCVFKNLDDTTNTAPVHVNKDAAEAVNGFIFTNNVIDGATGGSKSGIYLQATGEVIVKDNVINNVAFRPFVIQIITDDGIADNFVVTGNTFSGSAVGRAQGLGSNAEGSDAVNLVVSGNIFKGITDAQQICYWNFNAEKTTADLSKNYYDIDIAANPSRIYYNSAAASAEDLVAMGVYPIYTALNEDGSINTSSLKTAP